MRDKRVKKRAQVTVFIIIAIIVVAILVLLLYPRIKIYVSPVTATSFMETCVSNHAEYAITNISAHGGSLEPENAILYKDNRVEYLCYTNEYYKTCSNQQPLLRQHVEEEISAYLKPKVQECVNQLASDYEKKGYDVSAKKADVSVSLVPGSVKITANAPVTLIKGATESYDNFIVVQKSEVYNLVMIASSILNWEARYGDSNPETYMLYYPDIRVEKYKQEDGSKIYILTNKETQEKFIFATRSLSWPAGYGLGEEFVR
jgi:hypothetical protein